MATPISIVAYLALFVFVGFAFLFANLMVGYFLRPKDPNPEKLAVYECGEPTIGSSFIQFDLRFYVVALLFLIFDVEVAFFFPWANVFGTANHLRDPNLAVVTGNPPEVTAETQYLLNTLGLPNATLPAGSQPDKVKADLNQAATKLAWMSAADIAVFFAVLVVGFAYVWRRGDIDWVRAVQTQRRDTQTRRVSSAPRPREPALTG